MGNISSLFSFSAEKEVDLIDVAVDLKMQSRMLKKQADRSRAAEAGERKKVLQYLRNGDKDTAKVHAEDAIRNKREALNTHRFGVKMEALAGKVEGAARAQQMSETMKSTVPALQQAMQQMNSAGVMSSIGEFEKVFEDMEVTTEIMNQGMETVY